MNLNEFFENRLLNGAAGKIKFTKGDFENSDILLQSYSDSENFVSIPFEEILQIFLNIRNGNIKSPKVKILRIDEFKIKFHYDYLRSRGVGKDDAWEQYEGDFDFLNLKIENLENSTSY
jgi:hypothetical protein